MKPAVQGNRFAAAVAAFAAGSDARADALCREILRAAPSHGPTLTLAADVAFRRGEYDRAVLLARRGLAAGHAEAEHTLGCALSKVGRMDDAVAALRRSHARQPQDAQIEYNFGMLELAAGQWDEGFRHFEARWRVKPPPLYVRPWDAQWRGEPLDGKRVFVFAEQGFGDTIQFARYLPLLRRQGAAVTVGVQPSLFRLFSRLGVAEILKPGDGVPTWDFHVPIMSLAPAVGTGPDTVPPPLDLAVAAPAPLRTAGPRHIGLCWAGNRADPEDRDRSMPTAVLDDLLGRLSGHHLVSLQVDGEADLARCRAGAGVARMGDVADFADTVAIVAALDLVVTVDTAVAHLAGSLGRPTWLLLWTGCDWRWMRGGDTTPWYPAMRLFRQERRGDWRAPLRAVEAALAAPAAAA